LLLLLLKEAVEGVGALGNRRDLLSGRIIAATSIGRAGEHGEPVVERVVGRVARLEELLALLVGGGGIDVVSRHGALRYAGPELLFLLLAVANNIERIDAAGGSRLGL